MPQRDGHDRQVAGAAQPLAGIRVLDLGQVWAGPLLGVYLSDFGAEVIRVESNIRAGLQAGAQKPATDATTALAYEGLGRNRRSVALNLANHVGRELFLQLVSVSDIVFDNLSPRAVRKLGIGYEAMRRVNERIIVASLSAAGQYGPWSDVLTYGPSLTALYGIKSLLGYAGEGRIQEDVADLDPTAATYAMVAILAALRWRERTGEGQFIDMAQGEAGVSALAEAVMEYTLNGRVLGPTGNRQRMMAPHGIYPSRGDDCWIAIAVDSEAAWQALCTICGDRGAADDERFRDLFSRLRHQDELDKLIAGWTRAHNADELTAQLQQAGVASYPALDAYGVVADEQLSFRKGMTRLTAPDLKTARLLTGTPWGLSASPAEIHGPNRAVGADTGYVLGEVLGLLSGQIDDAVQRGGIG